MGTAVITLRIMPESPDTDLTKIEQEALKIITNYTDERQKKVSIEPVAFGLKSINITFLMDEKKGDTEPLEKQLSEIEGVNSVECVDVRRIVG
ncbi:MAG: effector protein [Candidatus Woesearchaeota archaeon]|nr:MAG: effector protein [Candidatus Woesearchaeota archaeon]